MTAYYNEVNRHAAGWLRNLIAAGLVPAGDVDERDIRDVRPVDLASYVQCHFFAGIGGWADAARLAGWADSRPFWSGSCPCQPFSAAGRGGGFSDQRHLWPAFFHLIRECRPGVVLGEQVASPDGLAWCDLVCADLEGEGYAFAPVDLCAAGFGAPHIRQRLFWVADAKGRGRGEQRRQVEPWQGSVRHVDGRGVLAGVWADADWLDFKDQRRRPAEPGTLPLADGLPGRMELLRGYGNAISPEVGAEFIRAVMECQP